MRILKHLLVALLMAFPALSQIPAPQIPLTGNIGCSGFPCVNSGTLSITTDADHTITAQETSASYIKVTSTVSLTATRKLIYPAGRFPVGVENASTGGQQIQVCGISGTCITIPNSTTTYTPVWNDGTNFVAGNVAGSGCAEGTCVVNAPTASQTVAQPTGTVFNVTGDAGVLRVNGVPACSYNGAIPFNCPTLTYGTSYAAFGDSITYGFTLSDINDRYPQVIATQLGISLNDYGVPGDMACDQFPHEITTNFNTHLTNNPLMSTMIGTNDVDYKGVGPYEAIFEGCHLGSMSWLVTPREDMVLPGDAAMTGTGTWSNTSPHGITTGIYGTGPATSGAGTMTATLTTYGNPIYGWYVVGSGPTLVDSFTLSVDGVAEGTYYTETNPTVSTQSGTPASVFLIRIPAAAGVHTIVAASSTTNMGILGFGTLPANKYFNHPVLLSGDLPNQCQVGQTCGGSVGPISSVADQLQYNSDIIADENLLISDGADIRHVPDRQYMLGTPAEMNDQLHSNAFGHTHYAQSFANIFQASPLVSEATSIAFSGVTSGTNANALVVGTGGSLTASGSGAIGATTLENDTWESPGFIGLTTPNGGFFTGVTVNDIRGRAVATGLTDPQGNSVIGMVITPDTSSSNYIQANTNSTGAFAWGIDVTGSTHQANIAYMPSMSVGISGHTGINTSGEATLGNGSTATTQTTGDTSNSVATDAFVAAAVASYSSAFSAITSGTNTSGAMVLGSGSSLTTSGTGSNNATMLLGSTWASPPLIGFGSANGATFTSVIAASIRGKRRAPPVDPQGTTPSGGIALTPDSPSANYIAYAANYTNTFAWGVDVTGATHQANTAYMPSAALTGIGPSTSPLCTTTGGLITNSGCAVGTGTVTSFSAGTLSPLFTTSVATATTTPALSFTASTAAQNSVLAGPASGGTGAYNFRALVAADIPSLSGVYAPLTNPSGGQNNYAPLASPTFTGTLTSAVQSQTGPYTNTANGAASTPAVSVTGTLFTGGTGTTTTPQVLFGNTGYTAWNTNGTVLGLYQSSGTADMIRAHGTTSDFVVDSAGGVSARSFMAAQFVQAGNGIFTNPGGAETLTLAAGSVLADTANTALAAFTVNMSNASATGDLLDLTNSAGTPFKVLHGGGVATPAITLNGGTTLTAQTGTGSTVVASVSPALTGIPTAPTATVGTNTTQIATMAAIQAASAALLAGTNTFTGANTFSGGINVGSTSQLTVDTSGDLNTSGTISAPAILGGGNIGSSGHEVSNLYVENFNPAIGRKGTFVCTAAGTITIANASELVTSDVIISLNTAGGVITTPPAMKTVTSGTGFSVLCGATDTSTYNYSILN